MNPIEQKATEIIGCTQKDCDKCDFNNLSCFEYKHLIKIAKWALSFKDTQPISELRGWHTEPPTEDGCYLAETFRIPYKNCNYIVAEYDTNAQVWYDEAYEHEIEIKRWKRI